MALCYSREGGEDDAGVVATCTHPMGLLTWALCHPKGTEFNLCPSWRMVWQSSACAWANEPGHRSLGVEPILVCRAPCDSSETG